MADRGLPARSVVPIVGATLIGAFFLIYFSQVWVEGAIPPLTQGADPESQKVEREISKIDAEIRRIKSDTLGSLFWLKLIALFVTVGGAVGGYVLGQTQSTQRRVDFEDRKNVDAVYQAIVKELSDEQPILRTAAAVKLGSVLVEFPHEWNVGDERKKQLIQLTKKVLAAALSIEEHEKVLKTLSINIALDKRGEHGDEKDFANLRELDLSGAKAKDAYWARCDLSYADLFEADLQNASLRHSILDETQFREADLRSAVLASTRCDGANFKLADLRGADFTGADLSGAFFEGARVHGARLEGATLPAKPEVLASLVDVSEQGDGSVTETVREWVRSSG